MKYYQILTLYEYEEVPDTKGNMLSLIEKDTQSEVILTTKQEEDGLLHVIGTPFYLREVTSELPELHAMADHNCPFWGICPECGHDGGTPQE